ncbi:heavy metal translocating P-type ATPase [Loktanella sp. S4079]|uniref:heavy metal translocating P-type ATPase n=1 Tax=Loktanella sp. S4079 TaxID=579483 RepID=UPI0005F9BFCD|nr:heavy metal translocating P-type ATPase [Loktanella sp. S4079]KJZ18288.1 ATPase [Loktanella sp. S4079]
MSTATFCPACVGTPEFTQTTATSQGNQQIILSLPGIHCIACMNGVEAALGVIPGVDSARVNLSLKRVTVGLNQPVPPETLIEALELAGFEARILDATLLGAQTDNYGRALMTRIAVSGFAMMNVMLLSVAVWSGAVGATQHLFHMISAMIALPAVVYAAQPFFHNAWVALSRRRLNMDVPISLAILLAAGMSLFETFVGGAQAYFDAALSLTFFLLIGRYLDHRSRKAAASAAAQLSALEVPRVLRIDGETREMIDFDQLRVGDNIQVLPGGRIPVDGVVITGQSEIDRSILTGESRTSEVSPNAKVTAGEINISGPLVIRANTVGGDTTLRRMATMIDKAEATKNRYTAIADRAAAIYAPMVHLLALVTFAGWIIYAGDLRLSLNIAVAVLIITCPCALGLAVPAVSTTAAGRLFRTGLLVKDGTALERIAETDTVIFDKTGTLTMPAADGAQLDLTTRAIALGLAQASSHPIAQAITRSLGQITPAPLNEICEHPGKGISAKWNDTPVRLGAGNWMGAGTGTYVQIDNQPPQKIALNSQLRLGAKELVAAWQKAGYSVHLVSGDESRETSRIAEILKITQWKANASPADKIAYVQSYANTSAKVLMVGDGLNDTGALAAAHASVSPASAVDASRAASDVVLLNDSLIPLIALPFIARAAKRRIIENFAISAAYNCIAIPIAVLGYATPLLAAIAMSVSSLTVLANAMRLRGGK